MEQRDKLSENAELFAISLSGDIKKVFDYPYYDVIMQLIKTSYKAGAVFGASDMKNVMDKLYGNE